MSDFFSRLAARALGLAPTLQPISAPIFAQEQCLQPPDADQLECFAEEETPNHNSDITPHDSHAQPQRAVSQFLPGPSPQYSQHDRQSHPDTLKNYQTSIPMHKSSIPEQVSFQDDRGQNDHDQDGHQSHPHIVTTDQQSVPMQMASTSELYQQHPMPTTTHETHIIHKEMTINNITQNQKGAFNTDNTGQQRSPEIRSARSLPPIERNVPVPLTPENVGPPLAVGLPTVNLAPIHTVGQMSVPPSPKHVGPTARGGLDALIQPPPTIQVTIGRVEVRATPSPSPSPTARPTPAPAVKSLDDYLRQREEGRVR